MRKVWYNEQKEKIIDKYTNTIINQYPSLINELNDNTILLTYDKFLSEFNYLVTCFTKDWEEIRLRGKFINIQNENDIPISKWYYSLNLEKQTNIIISLFQDTNNYNEDIHNLFDISLTILKHDLEKNELKYIITYDFSLNTNIQIELNLPAGNYIIYPRTTGCFFNELLFNINNSNNNGNKVIYDLESKQFSKIFINTIKDIFKKYDIYLNNYLNYEEFNNFYKCIKNKSLSEKEYNINIVSKYQSYNKSITEKGFINFFKNKYLEENGKKEIKTWLKNLGYTENFFSLKEKSFIITFHSDNPIKVKLCESLCVDLPIKIEKIILKNNGEIIKKKDKVLVIRYKSKNHNFFTYGVINNDNITLRISLSFKENDNIIFNENKSFIDKIVKPGKYEFYVNLFYLNNDINSNDCNFDFDFNLNYFNIQ